MSNSWVKFLGIRGICHPDEVGNMPCDNGCICDKCHAEYIHEDYDKWLKEYRQSYNTTQYICDWCGEHSSSESWTQVSRTEAMKEGTPYPDYWNMQTAHGGDYVTCPKCGAEDERSEVVVYLSEEEEE